jgi:hypothetical protein
MSLLHEPLLTWELDRRDFQPDAAGSYVHAISQEARSQLDPTWLSALPGQPTMVEVVELGEDIIEFRLDGTTDKAELRDSVALQQFLGQHSQPLYVDFTGFTHRAWAPLVRAAIALVLSNVFFVYVEPYSYTRTASPSPGSIYDLSVKIEGIRPLPGFASLARRARESSICFVPMLGFEGTRLGHLLAEVDPTPGNVEPIVGLPGFRIEYPYAAYLGNRDHLEAGFLHRRVRFAKANCPFDAFHVLHRISTDHPKDVIQLAPIGTKPHALAAVLFALARPGRVEIVYDNPIRKDKRSEGEARVCVYDIGCFLKSDLYAGVGRYA